MPAKRSYPRSQNLLLTLQLLGDMLFSYHRPVRRLLAEVSYADSAASALKHRFQLSPSTTSSCCLGAAFLIMSYAYLRLYDARLLLRPQRAANIILRGTFFWFLLFLSTSLILKFDPPISRIFVATSCLTTLAVMLLWRFGFFYILSKSEWRERITQRVALVGWSGEAENLTQAILNDENHPYSVHGVISTPRPGHRSPGTSACWARSTSWMRFWTSI
jgi:FlaA1/EpsC-like NDP-sugar epimerase